MSTDQAKLTDRQKQIYLRLLARTLRYPFRLVLAILFNILFRHMSPFMSYLFTNCFISFLSIVLNIFFVRFNI